MQVSRERQRNIQWVMVTCAIALTLKAAQLQLFDDSFRRRADATTIEKLTVLSPARPRIDRNRKLVVNNEAMYDLMVTYNQVNFEHMDVPSFANCCTSPPIFFSKT